MWYMWSDLSTGVNNNYLNIAVISPTSRLVLQVIYNIRGIPKLFHKHLEVPHSHFKLMKCNTDIASRV